MNALRRRVGVSSDLTSDARALVRTRRIARTHFGQLLTGRRRAAVDSRDGPRYLEWNFASVAYAAEPLTP